ncbi:MAG: GTP-binding protein [Croceitalea sp.]|nr:GTP-binding protein [Croceitalea sp.]MBT8237032.1 GTP-binding protein [Croceitalea sp.]NNM17758.1 GTP-binding protein [Croceitalea sp.]
MQKSKKIVLVGHFGVGKTSLIRRFVKNEFSNNYQVTIGVHITKKEVQIEAEKSINLIIWDLEGTDDLRTMRPSYLMGSHGAIFVFDVSRPSTFQNLNEDLALVNDRLNKVPLLVVGNKIDLVNKEDLDSLLQEHQISNHFLTSAKEGTAVDSLFTKMAKMVYGHD